MPCEHQKIRVAAGVGRDREVEGGPVHRYSVEVSVICSECGAAFEFIGASTISADRKELSAPIAPLAAGPELVKAAGSPLPED